MPKENGTPRYRLIRYIHSIFKSTRDQNEYAHFSFKRSRSIWDFFNFYKMLFIDRIGLMDTIKQNDNNIYMKGKSFQC